MASSPLDVAREVEATMGNVNKALVKSQKDALRQIGKAARATMNKQAPIVPGGDRRFSGMSRYNHGGRLGVTFSVKPLYLFLGSKGPWKIAEVGADPHRFGSGMHPGTRRSQGRAAWSKGATVALADAEDTLPETMTDAVERAFYG